MCRSVEDTCTRTSIVKNRSEEQSEGTVQECGCDGVRRVGCAGVGCAGVLACFSKLTCVEGVREWDVQECGCDVWKEWGSGMCRSVGVMYRRSEGTLIVKKLVV